MKSNLIFRYVLFLVLILVSSIFYFYRLGEGDLVEWDEAHYVSRVLAILYNNFWLDQSNVSISGLWISSHPPFVIWIMAIVCKMIGISEFAVRLVPALSGIGCGILMYILGQNMDRNKKLGLVNFLVLILIPFFTTYARMAQLDIPVLFWTMFCLVLFWCGLKGKNIHFIFSGITFGFGLMSKIAVVLICPLIISLYILLEFLKGTHKIGLRGLKGLLVIVIIGGLIASPWYILITMKLGSSYWQQAIGYHVFSRIIQPLEGHTSQLGILFWPIQVLKCLKVFFPIFILGLTRKALSSILSSSSIYFLFSWFFIPFLIFTIAATKYPPYLIIFLPPIIFFSSIGLIYLFSGETNRKLKVFICLVSFFVFAFKIYNKIEDIIISLQSPIVHIMENLIFIFKFSILVVVAFYFSIWLLNRLSKSVYRKVIILLYSICVFLPAVYFSLRPLGVSPAEWIGLRTYLRSINIQKVELIGDTTAVSQFYLMTITPYKPVAWEIESPTEFVGGDKLIERLKNLTTGEYIILQKKYIDTISLPGNAFVNYSNKEFFVYGGLKV